MSSLKDKLEEFIQGIKSKLPGKSDDDEDYDDEYEEGEFDEKTEEISVKKSNKDSDEDLDDEDYDEDEDDEEDEDEEEAKKKKKKQVQIALIALIAVYLAYDTFMGTPEPEIVQAPVVKRPKRSKRKKPRTKKVKVKKENTTDSKVAAKEPSKEVTPKEKVVAAPNPETTPEPVKETPAVVEAPKVEEKEVLNELTLKSPDPTPLPEPVEPTMGEVKEDVPNVVGQVDENNEMGKSDLDKTLDKLSDDSPKMIEKFKKEKLEYEAPPSYLETGRGLIYNCVGKHWACVDKDSYMKCKKNADWSKENKKPAECFPTEVYRSFIDCRSIQIDKINTLAETSFCK